MLLPRASFIFTPRPRACVQKFTTIKKEATPNEPNLYDASASRSIIGASETQEIATASCEVLYRVPTPSRSPAVLTMHSPRQEAASPNDSTRRIRKPQHHQRQRHIRDGEGIRNEVLRRNESAIGIAGGRCDAYSEEIGSIVGQIHATHL